MSAIKMATPGELLNAEHEAMESLLGTVDAMADRLKAGEPVAKDDLYDVVTVLVDFTGGNHHTKEETVLFPALARALPHAGTELVRRLTRDHRALRVLVGSCKDLIRRSHTKATRKELGRLLAAYAKLLRAHIRAETERLLPEVALALSPAEQERIVKAFERVEREEIGAGMGEAYRSIIRRLRESYSVIQAQASA